MARPHSVCRWCLARFTSVLDMCNHFLISERVQVGASAAAFATRTPNVELRLQETREQIARFVPSRYFAAAFSPIYRREDFDCDGEHAIALRGIIVLEEFTKVPKLYLLLVTHPPWPFRSWLHCCMSRPTWSCGTCANRVILSIIAGRFLLH